MILGGLQKTTLIDYPGKIAAIVFTAGCNFNCHYCYNPELRSFSPNFSVEEFFKFLDRRKGQLDAVTVTGGEPTVHADLFDFISEIKKRDFFVKLDTQGSNPAAVRKLVENNLIDYIAMDIKAPLLRYFDVINCPVNNAAISESIEFVMAHAPDYEFRTTVVEGQLGVDDIEEIGKLIHGAKRHYLQKFVANNNLNDPTYSSFHAPSEIVMEEMRATMARHVGEAFVR